MHVRDLKDWNDGLPASVLGFLSGGNQSSRRDAIDCVIAERRFAGAE